MNGLTRFGRRRLERLIGGPLPKGPEFSEGFAREEVPTADKGQGLERNDQLLQGDFRGRFEHLSRYLAAAQGDWSAAADIGCGTGYGTHILSKKGTVVGMDVSPAALRYARVAYSGCDYVLGDGHGIPLRSEGFDAVTAFEVVEHVAEPEALLKECGRLLKRGGVLYLSSPNPAHIGNLVRKAFMKTPIPHKTDPDNVYHIHEFRYDEMLSVASSNGYELVWSRGQTLPLDHILPKANHGIRKILGALGLVDVYDWMLSVLGGPFPSLSWTVVYALRRR